jgi:hypothetical protein
MTRFLRVSISLSLLVLAVVALLAWQTQRASAGYSFVVDTTVDDVNLNACTAADNDCSLRGAIENADATPQADTIGLETGATYVLTGTADENVGSTGDLDIETGISIYGEDSTIDADDVDRVFDIDAAPGVQIFMRDLTIRGGHITDATEDGDGGGIRVTGGNLRLENVSIGSNDTAAGGGGISVHGDSSLYIESSAIGGNVASSLGGGVLKRDGTGTVEILDSTFSGNVGSEGGGIYVGVSDEATISETDFLGNAATIDCGAGCGNGGGGIGQGAGELSIVGGLFNGNTSATSGGGMNLATATVTNAIVSGNVSASFGGGIQILNGSIVGSTITGNTGGSGGGVFSWGATVQESVINGNTATFYGGGVAIDQDGRVERSELNGNVAALGGGGIAISGETPSIAHSTINGNTAAKGGGIYRLDVNEFYGSGGGVVVAGGNFPGDAFLEFLTISSNTAPSGANIYDSGTLGDILLGNSIVAYSDGGSDCNVAVTSQGYNVEEGESCGLNATGDVDGTDPLLGPMADNGGPTRTRAIPANSPAVDRVPTPCGGGVDQRGAERPSGAGCDSGAFELGGITPSASATPSATPDGVSKVWGDFDCGADVDDADLAELLRFMAGIPVLTQGCFPDIHDPVYVDGTPLLWGDLNCDGATTPLDLIVFLAVRAGATPTIVGSPCPTLEDEVTVTD